MEEVIPPLRPFWRTGSPRPYQTFTTLPSGKTVPTGLLNQVNGPDLNTINQRLESNIPPLLNLKLNSPEQAVERLMHIHRKIADANYKFQWSVALRYMGQADAILTVLLQHYLRFGFDDVVLVDMTKPTDPRAPMPDAFIAKANAIIMRDPELGKLHQEKADLTPVWDLFFRLVNTQTKVKLSKYDKLERVANQMDKMMNRLPGPYTVKWSRQLTINYFRIARQMLERKGYRLKKRHKGMSNDEVTFDFISKRGEAVFSFTFVKDMTWLFDVAYNGLVQPLMVMNFSKRNQPQQGLPASMTQDNWDGTFSPQEGRLYDANWRRILHWVQEYG